MKQLQKKVILLIAGLFAGFSLLFYFYTTSLIKEKSFAQQQQAVESEVFLLANQLIQKKNSILSKEETTNLLHEASQAVGERITWIDSNGQVLFDSRVDVQQTENHLERPEVRAVLEGKQLGTDIRTSDTTGRTLFYAAVPFQVGIKESIGILRMSKPIDEMEEVFTQIRQSLLSFMVISVIIILFFTTLWTKRFTDPMQEIASLTTRLSEGEYDARYGPSSYAEVDQLGNNLNILAQSLAVQKEEIERNGRQLTELVQNLVVGVLLLNDEKRIERANPAMNTILKNKNKFQSGLLYMECIHNPTLVSLIEQAYAKKETQNQEIILYDRGERIIDASVIPYENEWTKNWNAIVILYDLTHTRRLEKVRTDFVANASHELRTPLTALKGFSETLLDGAMDDREVLKDFLEVIHQESERLDAIVGDILELSKLESQQVSFEQEKTDIRAVVDETIRLLKEKASKKQISLVRDFDEPFFYPGDKNRIKQILMNLTDNAISYTPERGNVRINCKREARFLILSVTDTGIGISKKEQQRIFERFYRVDKARSRNSGGTGLGLSIVKYLVENFNGKITVESEQEKGTTFSVHLPL